MCFRFVSTDIIGGKVQSVWDCGAEAASWISKTLTGKDSGLRLIYHYSDRSQRSHSKLVMFIDMKFIDHIYLYIFLITQYLRPFGDTMGETHLPAFRKIVIKIS